MAMGFKTIIFLLVLLVGVPLLQIFLSRRESKWPGLILPLLTFLYSLLMACSAVAYNGEIPWGAILASLILGNIPTALLLVIYFACREKLRKRSELDKISTAPLRLDVPPTQPAVPFPETAAQTPPAADRQPKTKLEHLGDEVLAELAKLMP